MTEEGIETEQATKRAETQDLCTGDSTNMLQTTHLETTIDLGTEPLSLGIQQHFNLGQTSTIHPAFTTEPSQELGYFLESKELER